ncbi:MAG: copper oxidase [Shewanella sp. CG12_big_fil_rev_8_21_14_0_65_47_15]|nr:MAG: copper oxidase [Shewanella sp. CG12_big_fil_rev_8_21_14_0_65_47_15]
MSLSFLSRQQNNTEATRCNFDINGKVNLNKPSNLTLECAKDFVDETQ